MVLLIKEGAASLLAGAVRRCWPATFPYAKITASRYAKGMLTEVPYEPLTLTTSSSVVPYIEARSRTLRRAGPVPERRPAEVLSPLLRSKRANYQDYLTWPSR